MRSHLLEVPPLLSFSFRDIISSKFVFCSLPVRYPETHFLIEYGRLDFSMDSVSRLRFTVSKTLPGNQETFQCLLVLRTARTRGNLRGSTDQTETNTSWIFPDFETANMEIRRWVVVPGSAHASDADQNSISHCWHRI